MTIKICSGHRLFLIRRKFWKTRPCFWWVTVKAERSVILRMDKLKSDCCPVSSLNIEDMSEKSGNIRRQQTSCRGQERVNVDLMLYILT